MDNIALDYKEKYLQFPREVREWGAYTFMKNQIENFK